jgi:predicted PurR-regulated permease PerM
LIQRVNQNLLCIVLVIGVLFLARIFLIPLTFAILLAMLMLPVCRYLDNKGLHRAISVLVCVLILLIAICTVVTIIGMQILSFTEDLPQIKERGNQFLSEVQAFAQQHFSVSSEKQQAFLKKQMATGASIGALITVFFLQHGWPINWNSPNVSLHFPFALSQRKV